jgi:hypothetical protein
MHDGAIVPFDPAKLDADDRIVFENYGKISFETVTF